MKKYVLIDVITNSDAAFKSLEKFGYNMVICDLDDPGNVDRFKNLKKYFPWKSKKFVFMARGVASQEIRVLLSEFPGKWILKPINEISLMKLIDKINSQDRMSSC